MAHLEGQASDPQPRSSGDLIYDIWFLAGLFVLGLGLCAIGVWQLLPGKGGRPPTGR
jgi:hypothetical protein